VTAATHPLRARPPGAAVRAKAPARRSLTIELAAFAALGAYGAGHWTRLVVDPPVGRFGFCVAIATAGGAALALLPRARVGREARLALLAGTALLTLAAALVAMGLPARLLLPGGWSELGDGLDRGLTGVQSVSWPYGGTEEWVRLVVLLGVPLLLAIAAWLAFWPAGRAAPLMRGLGLAVLLLLYGTAVTEHEPSAPLLRGLGLLVLVGAYLWLPRMSSREARLAGAVMLFVGVLALPFAAKLDAADPWWNYRDFNWFGHGRSVTFQWEHTYGPLDWPREGTTLMNIKSRTGHYWKAEVLDRFDGFRWLRSNTHEQSAVTGEIPSPSNRRWFSEFRVTVRALRTDFVVGAGNPIGPPSGVSGVIGSEDGTFVKFDGPLERGDSYTVEAYTPDPTADQLRAVPDGYPDGLIRYTQIFLPRPGQTALEGNGLAGDASRSAEEGQPNVFVDLRGDPRSSSNDAERRLEASPYAGMYETAKQVTAPESTPYDEVKAVERYLKSNFDYQERVPSHDYPLQAFLSVDKRGYCQQFSGAMALMLRMVGIPARVVAGFSPGSYNTDTGEWRVRDLDAHSWVEVYFTGIGWVPFDPTPAQAPAQSRAVGLDAASAAVGGANEGRTGNPGAERVTGNPGAAKRSDGGGTPWHVILGLALLALPAAAWWRRRRRRAVTGPLADAQLDELRYALQRLGWRLPESTTLLGLERRLARAAGPGSAAYAARLRAHRYDPRDPGLPGRSERRALRRELTAYAGLLTKIRALLALPPGGPRPRTPTSG
jgi:protein-glutamine gamma-glutamyltransferase